MELVGSDGETYQREVIRHPGAVVLIPILDDGRLVLIENNRPTVGETLLNYRRGPWNGMRIQKQRLPVSWRRRRAFVPRNSRLSMSFIRHQGLVMS